MNNRLNQNENKRLAKYKDKFAKLDIASLGLYDGEKIVHCDDFNAADKNMYCPEWAVTNMGRGYSLSHNKWLVPVATGTREYWHFVGSRQPAVHKLVMHYFMEESDKLALEVFGAAGVEVHHGIPIDLPEELKFGKKSNRKARIEHCMAYNCKLNLFYQGKYDHKCRDGRIIHGQATTAEIDGSEEWDNAAQITRKWFANSGNAKGNANGARVVYFRDANGEIRDRIVMSVLIKGSRDKDAAVYQRILGDFVSKVKRESSQNQE